MATESDIIRRALRLCRVIDANQAPAADEVADARTALNAMAARWVSTGLLPAWTPTTEPTDTLVSPAAADDAISYNLAVRIAIEYGTDPGNDVRSYAERTIADLWREKSKAAKAGAFTDAGGIYTRADLRNAVLFDLGRRYDEAAPDAEGNALIDQRVMQVLAGLYEDGLIPFDIEGDEVPARFMVPIAQVIAPTLAAALDMESRMANLIELSTRGMKELRRLKADPYFGTPQRAVYF